MVQLARDYYENVTEHLLKDRAYRMLNGGLSFDRLRKKLSDEPKDVDLADLELQGPARDVQGHGVWIHMELCGNSHCGGQTVRTAYINTGVYTYHVAT